jgi:MFS family permease
MTSLPLAKYLGTKLPSGAWLVVGLLCGVGALNYADRGIVVTMRASIIAEIPMTDSQFGLLTGVFLWVYGFLSPFAGFLADKFSRSRVILISLFIWSALTLLTSYATTFNQLLITRALMGISEACYLPAAVALIVDYHKSTTRSSATGIHLAGVTVGQSLGFLGGWIAEKHSWHTSFFAFGFVGILYSIVLILFLKDPTQDKISSDAAEKIKQSISFSKAVKHLFSKRAFILIIGFYSLLGIVGWLITGWLPTYYKENFNLSQSLAGLYATAYLYPAALIGAILGGYLTDRWSKTNPQARILVPAIGLCIAAPFTFMASYTTVLPLAIFFFMFYALTRVFTDVNIMPMLCFITDKNYRATGLGIINMFATLVGGIGIVAGGALRDRHIELSLIYQSAAFLIIICIILLMLMRKRVKWQTNPDTEI